MRTDIKKVYIDNDFFGKKTLDLFDKDKERITIIYGGNAAGKTTIGRAIYNIKEETDSKEYIQDSCFKDKNNKDIVFSDDEKSRIHVFNEDFVDRKILFKTRGKFDAVVMFGESIENESKIQTLEDEIKELQKKQKEINIEIFNDGKNVVSPEYYKTILKKEATLDWAELDRKIRDNKNKRTVTDDIIDTILNTNISKIKDTKMIEQKIENFLAIGGKTAIKITNESLKQFEFGVDIGEIQKELSKSFNHPIGSKITSRINKTLSERGLERLNEIKDSFEEGYCPHCFREIDQKYIEQIIEEINRIQSKEIENHIDTIKNLKIDVLELELDDFISLDSSIVQDCKNQILKANELIKKTNHKIEMKINSPYSPVDLELKESDINIFDELEKNLALLEAKRAIYNESIDNFKNLSQEAEDLNLHRFAFKQKETIKNYIKQLKEKQKTENDYNTLLNKIAEKDKSIKQLTAENKNITIALSKLNDYLRLIFLSNKRLYLEEDNGFYVVKSNGKNIALKKLSKGEQNAIALCYFFIMINSNRLGNKMFNFPCLVVLYDPISSFDYNNKMGIYAFLRKMFNMIQNNKQSKIIVLTHQIESFFDLKTIVEDIDKSILRTSRLFDKNIIMMHQRSLNVYRYTLNEVYNIVTKEETQITNEEIEELGNKLRKVLEAFSTFNYGCGISSLSVDNQIIDNLHESEKIRDYFTNSMFRISLNTTSHLEERVYSLSDLMNLVYFDKEGMLRSAKDVLTLMYLLNKRHLEKMLDNFEEQFFVEYLNTI